MKIRMLFGTHLPPLEGETDLQDLRCGTTVDVDDAVAQTLIKDGRAESAEKKGK